MQIIAVGKLTGRAREWYYSKPDFVTMDWNSFKEEMRKMYTRHHDIVSLRRTFEKRKWKQGQPFADYFHRLPEVDIIQYVIEGFDNRNLQNQARMMLHNVKSLEDLFKIMTNVTSDYAPTQNFSRPRGTNTETRAPISNVA